MTPEQANIAKLRIAAKSYKDGLKKPATVDDGDRFVTISPKSPLKKLINYIVRMESDEKVLTKNNEINYLQTSANLCTVLDAISKQYSNSAAPYKYSEISQNSDENHAALSESQDVKIIFNTGKLREVDKQPVSLKCLLPAGLVETLEEIDPKARSENNFTFDIAQNPELTQKLAKVIATYVTRSENKELLDGLERHFLNSVQNLYSYGLLDVLKEKEIALG